MSCDDFQPLSTGEIEVINSYGPYNHAVWRGRGVAISHEEGLRGRMEFLSRLLRGQITRQFSTEQIRGMSILDVGCYDGWLLESIGDLPFARMVGIEFRAENIERGRWVRKILNISSRGEYRQGDVDHLPVDDPFDIVVCTGLLHHVESVAVSMRSLCRVCRRALFLECATLAMERFPPALVREVELKDIAYRYSRHLVGFSAQKIETSYYPGSSGRLSVVEVPTEETLLIHLQHHGFIEARAVTDWPTYRAAMPDFHRAVHASVVWASASASAAGARVSAGIASETSWVDDYEAGMLNTLLPEEWVRPLHAALCGAAPVPPLPAPAALIHLAWLGPEWRPRPICQLVRRLVRWLVARRIGNAFTHEILASLPYQPQDKIRIEWAKVLLARGKPAEALAELRLVTSRLNADWRACYRAFHLGWRAATTLGDTDEADRFKALCLRCNPKFPVSLFDAAA